MVHVPAGRCTAGTRAGAARYTCAAGAARRLEFVRVQLLRPKLSPRYKRPRLVLRAAPDRCARARGARPARVLGLMQMPPPNPDEAVRAPLDQRSSEYALDSDSESHESDSVASPAPAAAAPAPAPRQPAPRRAPPPSMFDLAKAAAKPKPKKKETPSVKRVLAAPAADAPAPKKKREAEDCRRGQASCRTPAYFRFKLISMIVRLGLKPLRRPPTPRSRTS